MKLEDFLGITFIVFIIGYFIVLYNILLNTKIGNVKDKNGKG